MTNVTVSKSVQDMLPTGKVEYTNTAMGIVQLIMLAGFCLLKLRKRLQSNEAKVETMEQKMSRLYRTCGIRTEPSTDI